MAYTLTQRAADIRETLEADSGAAAKALLDHLIGPSAGAVLNAKGMEKP